MSESKQQHTPTPWKHDGREIVTAYTGPGGRVIAIGAHGSVSHAPAIQIGDDDFDLCMANLAFIARAVNSHEALVEALREARLLIAALRDGLNPKASWEEYESRSPQIQQINAALALAEKES